MLTIRSRAIVLMVGASAVWSTVNAGVLQGTGPYNGPPGFGRGMQSTQHCGNNPESWVRGSVSLDTQSTEVIVTAQLESDSVREGPKGKLHISVKDSTGKVIATVESAEIGMGGKPPGRAIQRNFNSTVTIPADVASRAASLTVVAQCTGSVGQLWGIDLGKAQDEFKLVAAIVGS